MNKKRVSIFLLIGLVGLPQISETIYTPSLPNMANFFNTPFGLVEWTLMVYFLGFAGGVGTWGRVSDFLGRRKTMLLGLVVYVIFSLFCSLSSNINELFVCRFLQGFGISVGSVITMTIMRDIYTDKERAIIFSIISMAIAFSPAIGPFVGGILVQFFHWKMNFIVLAVLGSLLLASSFFYLPETHANLEQKKSYPFVKTAVQFFTDKNAITSTLIVGLFNGIIFSYYAEAPYLFIDLLSFKPTTYGALGILLAASGFLGSYASKQLNHIISSKRIIILGCIISFFSATILLLCAIFSFITPQHKFLSFLALIIPIVGIFFGFGLSIPNSLSIALMNFKEVLGTAGSIMGSTYYLIVALVMYIMGAIHNGSPAIMPNYFFVLTFLMLVLSMTSFSSGLFNKIFLLNKIFNRSFGD